MTHVSVNVKKPKIQIDTLVVTDNGSIGVVTQLTKRWAHVFMLINNYAGDHNYHVVKQFKRAVLGTMPKGHKLSLVNKG